MKFQTTVVFGAALAACGVTAMPAGGSAPAPSPPRLPGPPGVAYTIQRNVFQQDRVHNLAYDNFHPAYFNNHRQSPLVAGPSTTLEHHLSLSPGSAARIFGSGPYTITNMVVQQHGFIYSKNGGTYRINIQPDNSLILFYWQGGAALNPSRGNMRYMAVYHLNYQKPPVSIPLTVPPNTAIPFRFMVANDATATGLIYDIDIIDPNGRSCFDPNNQCLYAHITSPNVSLPFGRFHGI